MARRFVSGPYHFRAVEAVSIYSYSFNITWANLLPVALVAYSKPEDADQQGQDYDASERS
jgi:hypothetical protein